MDTNKKILIVDDEVDLTQMIGFQFKAKGFNVKTAGDGLEALNMVHQFQPDLIILDINMPRMGGVEFYSKICGSNTKPLYPVLVLTARANIKELFHDLEIDGFMVKPFEIDQLVHEAEVIIKKKTQATLKKKEGLPRKPCKIGIVDDNPKSLAELGSIFLNADFMVIPAKSGAAAMERMTSDVPDVALVHLGLSDIPGDIVIFRLSQMAKTMDVQFILYTSANNKHDPQVMERIKAKKGIMTFVEYKESQDLLAAVNNLF